MFSLGLIKDKEKENIDWIIKRRGLDWNTKEIWGQRRRERGAIPWARFCFLPFLLKSKSRSQYSNSRVILPIHIILWHAVSRYWIHFRWGFICPASSETDQNLITKFFHPMDSTDRFTARSKRQHKIDELSDAISRRAWHMSSRLDRLLDSRSTWAREVLPTITADWNKKLSKARASDPYVTRKYSRTYVRWCVKNPFRHWASWISVSRTSWGRCCNYSPERLVYSSLRANYTRSVDPAFLAQDLRFQLNIVIVSWSSTIWICFFMSWTDAKYWL